MKRKLSAAIAAATFGLLFMVPALYADTTTVIEQTTTKTVVPKPVVKKKARAVKTEVTTSVVTTKDAEPRAPLDENALKKLEQMMCTQGFKVYYSNDKKNVCASKASAPDIAYTCVWGQKGEAVFPPTEQGPCKLDFAEHRGNIVIEKGAFVSRPPLKYGTKAQCCFRAAKGDPVTTIDVKEMKK